MTVTIMLYGPLKPSITVRRVRTSPELEIPLQQFILEDEAGNEIVCNIRGSQFFSFLSNLRSAITSAQVEFEVQERLERSRMSATEIQQSADSRMSLTLEDMVLKQKDEEAIDNDTN